MKYIQDRAPRHTLSIKEDVQTLDLYTNNEPVTMKIIFKKVGLYIALLFMCFGITTLLNPLFLQKISSIIPNYPSWSVVALITANTCGDILGRTFAQLKDSYSPKVLIIGNCLRCIFIFSTFYIVLAKNSFTNNTAVILANTFLVLFTNSFLIMGTSNSLNLVLDPHEKELGGFIICVTITLTNSISSLVSYFAFSNLGA
jgi:hypothetical protein